MQIAIFQQDKQATLSIECTAAGREALLSNQLAPRERQLLLLLDRNTDLSMQAVSHLLQKIDINELANKGWITYQLSTQTQLGNSTAVINQHINVKFVNSVDKKTLNHRLQSFSKTYGTTPDTICDTVADDDAGQIVAIEREIQTALNNSQHHRATATQPVKPHQVTRSDSIRVERMRDNRTRGNRVAYEPVHESFEDIMIAQSLLDL